MYTKDFSRRSLLRGAGSALAITSLQAMEEEPESYGVGALLDGSGVVAIRAGEFWMGSEDGHPDGRPVHRVRLGAFEMSKFEVTQSQWKTVMMDPHSKAGEARPTPQGHTVGSDPSHFKDPFLPVDSVSWDDIAVFLKRLNARDGKHTWRLPTEAEWEYASRAGTTGDDPQMLPATAWHKSNSGERTHQVGQKQANSWGLYDMDGNVSEWVADWYGHDYYAESPAANPIGPEEGSYRVYRGGCWFDNADLCSATLRRFDFPVSRFYNVGFRLVRSAGSGRS